VQQGALREEIVKEGKGRGERGRKPYPTSSHDMVGARGSRKGSILLLLFYPQGHSRVGGRQRKESGSFFFFFFFGNPCRDPDVETRMLEQDNGGWERFGKRKKGKRGKKGKGFGKAWGPTADPPSQRPRRREGKGKGGREGGRNLRIPSLSWDLEHNINSVAAHARMEERDVNDYRLMMDATR